MKTNKFFKVLTALAIITSMAAAQTDWGADSIRITKESQLREFAEWVNVNGWEFSNQTIILDNDIALTGEWTPIGNNNKEFEGTFDGNGKTISNLSVFDYDGGLFNRVGTNGQIKNITVNVKKARGGGLVGYYASIKPIENCGVNGAGLVGTTAATAAITISNCYTTGGRLVERAGTLTVKNSHSTVDMVGDYSCFGGLVDSGGVITIENSYTTGNVSVSTNVNGFRNPYSYYYGYYGGLVGRAGTLTISDSYAMVDVSFQSKVSPNSSDHYYTYYGYSSYSYCGGLVGNASTLTVKNSYAKGNVSSHSNDSSSYSYCGGLAGAVGGAVEISNSYSRGDISSSSVPNSYCGGLIGYGGGKITIGNSSYYEGNISSKFASGGLVGYGAKEITISDSYTEGDIISSSSFYSEIIKGTYYYYECYSYCGGLVGYGKDNIAINNSYSASRVSSTVPTEDPPFRSSSYSYSGGLLGYVDKAAKITDSYTSGKVSSSKTSSGGLVGCGKDSIIINRCYTTGDVSAETYSGGLVGGYKYGNIKSVVIISGSYTTGNISGNYCGGLLGLLSGTIPGDYTGIATINNSYARGNVLGGSLAGGLVGMLPNGSITNCYSTGNVGVDAGEDEDEYYGGGLVGSNRGVVTACYVLEGSAGKLFGENTGTITPTSGIRTEAQMKQQSTYNKWDFVDIWRIAPEINDGFPYLLASKNAGPTPINAASKTNKKHGILLEKAVVSHPVKISVKTPEQAQVNIVIYDNTGNVVYKTSGKNTDTFVWNLTNAAGRNVANGSYLIITEAIGNKGTYAYSAKVGVKR